MSKVFVSYSHDSDDHRQKVLAFANQLRKDGVDCTIDQYLNGAPPEGWPLWMEREMEKAEYVLIICTETYLRRVRGEEPPGKGKGVKWESLLTYTDLYESDARNIKFIPVLFQGENQQFIPKPLKATNFYLVTNPDSYLKLYRRLTDQPAVTVPELGAKLQLDKPDVPDFFDSPITSQPKNQPAPVPDRSEERKDLQEKVRTLVQRNRIKEALNAIAEILNPTSDVRHQIDVQIANWDNMTRSERLGIKSTSELSLERNKIVYATLGIANDLRDEDLN